MSYLTVITLAEAKNYLRIDDSLNEDDLQITQMIKTALKFIEDKTRVFVYARDVTYKMINGCKSVYDAPINSVVAPTTFLDSYPFTLHTEYVGLNSNSDGTYPDLVLNVGHEFKEDVPDDLLMVAFEIIDLLYYSHETGKSIAKDLSQLSREILNNNKRFLM